MLEGLEKLILVLIDYLLELAAYLQFSWGIWKIDAEERLRCKFLSLNQGDQKGQWRHSCFLALHEWDLEY